MSINVEIGSRISEGRLVELGPTVSSDKTIRRMYLEKGLFNDIFRVRTQKAEIARFAQLQADLEVFITSPTIDPNYLFGLTPKTDGVWEIKSKRPKPSIRVFGFFAKEDTFIATHYIERTGLGGWNSREWKTEIRRALSVWRKLFPAYSPDNSGEVSTLVTGAIDGKYFK